MLGTESAHLYQFHPRKKKLIYLGLLHSYTRVMREKKFLGTLDTFNGQKGQIGVSWLSTYKII